MGTIQRQLFIARILYWMDEGSSGDGYIYRYTRMMVTTTVQYVCDTFLMTTMMMMMTHTSSTV